MQESWKFLLEAICETQEGDAEDKKNEKDSIKQLLGKRYKQRSNHQSLHLQMLYSKLITVPVRRFLV